MVVVAATVAVATVAALRREQEQVGNAKTPIRAPSLVSSAYTPSKAAPILSTTHFSNHLSGDSYQTRDMYFGSGSGSGGDERELELDDGCGDVSDGTGVDFDLDQPGFFDDAANSEVGYGPGDNEGGGDDGSGGGGGSNAANDAAPAAKRARGRSGTEAGKS